MLKIKQIIHIDDINTEGINYEVKNIIEGDRFIDIMTEVCSHKKYTPSKGDKLWIYPKSNIPRFKMKQFCQNNKVALVKDREKATHTFMSSDYINEMLYYDSYNEGVDASRIIAWLTKSISKTKIEFTKNNNTSTIEQLISDITSSGNELVSISRYEYGRLQEYAEDEKDHLFNLKKNCLFSQSEIDEDMSNGKQDLSYWMIKDEYFPEISNIIIDSSIYGSNEILSRLNTGVVMTEDMYNQTQKMLKSNDIENQNVGIEAMASCDFQKSAVYLLMLIKSNSNTLYNNSNSKHVNFKSLLKFFNCTTQSLRSTDSIIGALKHQKLFSVENLNMLMPLVMEEIRKNGDTHYIKVKDVELSPEAEQALAENILDSEVEIVEDPKEQVLEPLHSGVLDSTPGAFT